jgi:hypothetical protein
MSEAAFAYIDQLMQGLGIPYAFMRWNDKDNPVPDHYFIGDYIEEPSMTKAENGYQQTTFILRGFTRGSWLLLEQAKAKIESAAMKTAILPNGNGIAIFYESASPVPTGDMELKSIKINLQIQEWKVN